MILVTTMFSRKLPKGFRPKHHSRRARLSRACRTMLVLAVLGCSAWPGLARFQNAAPLNAALSSAAAASRATVGPTGQRRLGA